MSLTMFSIGRDTQLVVIGPAGRVDLTHVTSFDSRQITHSVRVDRLDGTHMGTELPKGWEGSFELERGSSVVDDFIAATEQQRCIAGYDVPICDRNRWLHVNLSVRQRGISPQQCRHMERG